MVSAELGTLMLWESVVTMSNLAGASNAHEVKGEGQGAVPLCEIRLQARMYAACSSSARGINEWIFEIMHSLFCSLAVTSRKWQPMAVFAAQSQAYEYEEYWPAPAPAKALSMSWESAASTSANTSQSCFQLKTIKTCRILACQRFLFCPRAKEREKESPPGRTTQSPRARVRERPMQFLDKLVKSMPRGPRAWRPRARRWT